MSGFDSISSLFKNDKNNNGAQDKLSKKQQEITNKDIERQTQIQAQKLGLSYVNLFGFPIDHEAMLLIPEDQAIKEKLVCFFYDGENIKLGTTKPESNKIKSIIEELNKTYFTKSSLFFVSKNSLDYALNIYKIILLS